MKPEEVVQKALSAFEAGRTDEASKYLADDMVFTGPVPEPVSKDQFMHLQSNLIKGIPDWKFNFHHLRTEGDTVYGTVHITGTNNQKMPEIMPGMPMIPVTGKHVSLPEEPIKLVVHNDKIERMEVDKVPGGGVEGVMRQLGIPMK